MGGDQNEMLSCHLRDLNYRSVIPGEPWPAFNPGSMLPDGILEAKLGSARAASAIDGGNLLAQGRPWFAANSGAPLDSISDVALP
jgi:hypothetical protein